ncbi:hypothetical protein BGK67_03365 [Streptomyces subrutilus]|uniref:Uncharacterized protein n=2 Tax=Streptomyces subrutilus TaxID=36818 RepID=A0A1E5PLQ6_9ACTN|nr:hypothetical protein BGK67_03365 [Streptomyces subrutilus]
MPYEEPRPHAVVRRADRPGALGWALRAPGEAHDARFGWNTDVEPPAAGTVTGYGAGHDLVGQNRTPGLHAADGGR